MTDHNNKILAFTRLQRSYHNHLIHFMVLFFVTGLPLLSSHFSAIGYLFALPFDFLGTTFPDLATSGVLPDERLAVGLQVCRVIHRITALFFVIMSIPFVVVELSKIREWAIWPEYSWNPAELIQGFKGLWTNYVALGHARFGKFNVGQKLFAWTMIGAVTAITVSGFVLMFRGIFPQELQELSRFIHAASFILIAIFLIIHLYLALLPMNRKARNAMFDDGYLPVDYVENHHPIWYEKLSRKK